MKANATAEATPELTTAIVKKSPVQVLAFTIAQKQSSFASIQTRYLPAERLVKLAQVMVAKTPKLAECSMLSVIDSLMTCARLGLEPSEPGGVWLVPYKVSGRMICQSIIDYRGLLDVARRSGEIAAVHADLRYAADAWEFAIDTASPVLVKLRHVPSEGERGNVLGAYAIAKLKNGECHAIYLTKEQIEGFRKRSRGADSEYSPWVKDWDAMAKKTACRRLVNLLPRTPEVQVLREVLAREDAAPEGSPQPLVVLPEPSQEVVASEPEPPKPADELSAADIFDQSEKG